MWSDVKQFQCRSCWAIFDEPDVHVSCEDVNGEGAWEKWVTFYCPDCGSPDIERWDGETDA